jgi:hypothetical protein
MKTWAEIRMDAINTRQSHVWLPPQARTEPTLVSQKLPKLSLEAANDDEESSNTSNDSALSERRAHRPRKRMRRSNAGARLTFLTIQ